MKLDQLPDDGFFRFLVGDRISAIYRIVVTESRGEAFEMSGAVVLDLDSAGTVQVGDAKELGVAQAVIRLSGHEGVQIPEGYDRPLTYQLTAVPLLVGILPARVERIVEFQTSPGVVYGAEIDTSAGSFAWLMYPEDHELRPAGAVWDSVRRYGLEQMGRITLIHLV